MVLSRNETAEYLGVSTVTLWHWEREGKLIPLRDLGGHVFYSMKEIRDFIEKEEKAGRKRKKFNEDDYEY